MFNKVKAHDLGLMSGQGDGMRGSPSVPMRWLLMTLGTISLVLGLIGVVIPVLPTTPFLLFTAACYARSSRRLYSKLMGNRLFGRYLSDYYEGRGLSLPAKSVVIVFLWSMILVSAIFFVEELWLDLLLIVVASAVSVHVAMIGNGRG